jgi:hypothetical protein
LALSLLFAAGCRPEAESIRQFAERQSGFSISFDPAAESGDAPPPSPQGGAHWLELLTSGLTYDLVGLAPGAPADAPPRTHAYGLPVDADETVIEAITIRPGPHLEGGHSLSPVVRSLAALGASLAAMEGVEAIAWHPARCWSGAAYFREAVLRWIEGGVFPSLGLTALALNPDGGMHSEGLALFTGQEVRIEPELTSDRAAGAKIGVRLIDYLVDIGRIEKPQRIVGPDGATLKLEPSANGRFVRVWRG